MQWSVLSLAIIQNPMESFSELSPVFKANVYQAAGGGSGVSALCDARKG